jgi:cobalamin synthase
MRHLTDVWAEFADTLDSRGGTIALLFVSCVALGAVMLHIMHHGDDGQATSAIISTFSAFTGALLVALTSRTKANGNGNGNGNTNGSSTSTTTTTTEVKK